MKTYILYIVGLVALMAALALSIHAHLLWPSVALGVALLWLCLSLYGRIGRLLYAYRETEKESEKLHTRLAEAERQLQYLRQLTENVDTALFVCSTDGRIDWMNHAATQYSSPSGEVGRGLLPPHILSAIAEHKEVVDGCALSTVMLRIDGKRRLIVALKDVSMLMQRQEMEAWQQLIRVLTHEIMNSLTPIISISETLADSLPVDGGQEGASVINRRCHSLLDFVESYRQLTRIKAPERTTFPVADLFAHLKALFPKLKTPSNSPLKGEDSLPLREGREGSAGSALLYADRAQLEQVLINLIKNAYESGATEVELTASKTLSNSLPLREGWGGSVICVRDNGCGMSPDTLEHAFIPFFTTKPSGTGIGLSLCRQIILKHGGSIIIDSEEGRGTTFTIKL
ncbi:MAG: HAMP domain-containing histidine kinase [Bacteroidaceae bacterium]|nr:HAMP domain-containing histidine kinase [Bacteroidaceae bacterium]